MNSGPGTNAGPACAQIKGGHLCTFLYQKEKSHGKIMNSFGICENESNLIIFKLQNCFKKILEKRWWKGKATSHRDLPAVTLVQLGSHDVTMLGYARLG